MIFLRSTLRAARKRVSVADDQFCQLLRFHRVLIEPEAEGIFTTPATKVADSREERRCFGLP